MISLIMEGKFLQIEPVKYLQLAFFSLRGEGLVGEKGEIGTGSRVEKRKKKWPKDNE